MSKYPGIIATGSSSAMWYYNTILNTARQTTSDDYVFPLKILQTPFHELNAILPHQMDKAAKMLQHYLNEMKLMHTGSFILANITLHEAYDKLPANATSDLSFIHIRDILQKQLQKNIQVAVLGSAHTMQHHYIKNIITDGDSKVISLSKTHIKNIDELRKSYYLNKPDVTLSKEIFNQLLHAYPNVDVFLLACTELAIALEHFENKNKFLNLPELQCTYLVNQYL